MIDALAPQGDEICIPKTSSSVFISTNMHYVLQVWVMTQRERGWAHVFVCQN